MKSSIKSVLASAESLATDRDVYSGLIVEQPPLSPDNMVLFTRTGLRPSDYAGTVHHRYVLILFLQSAGTVFIQRKRVSAQEKQAVLIRPFEPHYYALPSGKIFWLFITFELPIDSPFAFLRQPCPVSDRAIQLLQDLMHAYKSGDAAACRLLLPLLLYEINRSQETIGAGPAADPGHHLAEKVNRYIHDHLKESITIRDLSRHCGVSSSHLRLKFRKTMGVSLGQYIRRIRFDHACCLLKTTDRTVSETAWQCGFTSPAVFCRAFKRETGKTAKNFRRAPGA
jgi:AraC-like DNA-binding protein